MADTLVFDWTFEPPGTFEEKAVLRVADREFEIDSGRVECRIGIPSDAPDEWRDLEMELHQQLNAFFLAAQALSHERCTLSPPSATRIDQQGRRKLSASVLEGINAKFTAGHMDVIVTNPDGTVKTDTKRERIDKRKALAKKAAEQLVDPVTNAILRSYSAAVSDPANELIHLYEIREALKTHYGSEQETKKALGISSDQWSTLGRISNDEPLLQGRHRGKHPGLLRNATEDELNEARAIARQMIEKYLNR